MLPIKWVVVAKAADGAQLERYFLRRDWKVRQILWQLQGEPDVGSIEIVALCGECGEEVPQCVCGVPLLAAPTRGVAGV